MKKSKLLLMIIVLLTGILLTSCQKEEEPHFEPSVSISEPSVPESDKAIPSGTAISDPTASKLGISDISISGIEFPVTIGEFKVSMREYAYFFFRTKGVIEQYRNEKWEKESSREELKEETLGYLTHQYTIRKMAMNYGFSLSQSDEEKISKDIRALENEKGGPDGFKRFLEESVLTEELLRYIMGADILEEKLLTELTEEETPERVRERLNVTWFRTQHIMIEVGEKFDEEERRTYAQSIYERAVAGEDFSELAAQYNEDPDFADEYFFTVDERRLTYEDNVFELEPGQISEVFWSDGNFCIVKRLPLTDEQISEKYEEVKGRSSYEAFGILFDSVMQGLTVSFDPKYDLLDMETMSAIRS